MPTHLTLMRHGETDWNTIGRWQGKAPIPLNENGKAQAREAAQHLPEGVFDRIIASDLLRARQTARIIADKLHLPVETDSRWREVDLGRWQGLTMPEIEAWDGKSHELFQSSSYMEREFPEGESNQDHLARTRKALQDIANRYHDEHVLVVSHGGSIRIAVYGITGERIRVAGNCTLTRLRYDHAENNWMVLGIAQHASEIKWA